MPRKPSHSVPKLKRITIGDDSLDLDYFFTHDFVDIDEPCQKIPAIIEWVNYHLQFFKQESVNLKQKTKEAEARAYFRLKNGGFEERGYGKMTEAALDKAVSLEDDVIQAHEDYAETYGWARRLENLTVSLQLRLDMLRSQEATRRKLMIEPSDD